MATRAEIESEQRRLLVALGGSETERSRLAQRVLELDESIAAARQELEGLRQTALRGILDARFGPIGLSYTLLPSGGVRVNAVPGGEEAFARFAAAVEDPEDSTVNEVLYFFGEQVPWLAGSFV